jgi:hypothetical protein
MVPHCMKQSKQIQGQMQEKKYSLLLSLERIEFESKGSFRNLNTLQLCGTGETFLLFWDSVFSFYI